jgi:hypothetical protein
LHVKKAELLVLAAMPLKHGKALCMCAHRSSARADTAGELGGDDPQEGGGDVVSKRVGRSTKASLAVNAEIHTVAAQVQARQQQQQQGRGRTQETGTGAQDDLGAQEEQEWPDDWAYLALNMVKVCVWGGEGLSTLCFARIDRGVCSRALPPLMC